jgi:hypothetical protein
VQLHLVDLRPAYSPRQVSERSLYQKFRQGAAISPCEARSMIPKQEAFAAILRYLSCRSGETIDTPARMARKLAHEGDIGESTLHTLICLDVLEDFGLVRTWREQDGDLLRVKLQKRRGKGKLSMYDSPIIQKLQAIAWETDDSDRKPLAF